MMVVRTRAVVAPLPAPRPRQRRLLGLVFPSPFAVVTVTSDATWDSMADAAGGGSGLDDATLAARVVEGDQHALAALYDRYGVRAYTLARRLSVDTRLAEEAVQEAFLTFWKNPSRYDPTRGKFSSWLLTVVHHKTIDLLRVQRKQSRFTVGLTDDDLSLVAPAPSADESVLARSEAEVVRAALIHLPAAQRRTLELAFYGGYTQLEIATILAIPIGTVKSRTFAAMATLRALLGSHNAHTPGGDPTRPARKQR